MYPSDLIPLKSILESKGYTVNSNYTSIESNLITYSLNS